MYNICITKHPAVILQGAIIPFFPCFFFSNKLDALQELRADVLVELVVVRLVLAMPEPDVQKGVRLCRNVEDVFLIHFVGRDVIDVIAGYVLRLKEADSLHVSMIRLQQMLDIVPGAVFARNKGHREAEALVRGDEFKTIVHLALGLGIEAYAVRKAEGECVVEGECAVFVVNHNRSSVHM